jgi:hypothetical protein
MNKYCVDKFKLQDMGLKMCSSCREIKSYQDFYKNCSRSDGLSHYCKGCITERNRRRGIRPLDQAKETGSYLGVHVAEKVLSEVFENAEWMPTNNPGYDLVCPCGLKVDVKSACLRRGKSSIGWEFTIRNNRVPDYFALLAFDNVDDLNPMHLWLIPGDIINEKASVTITNSPRCLAKWEKYEQPINSVVGACNKMKRIDTACTISIEATA